MNQQKYFYIRPIPLSNDAQGFGLVSSHPERAFLAGGHLP